MVDGFEPHDHFMYAMPGTGRSRVAVVGGRGVPGVVGMGGSQEGAIPVPTQDHPRDPLLVIFQALALPTAK